MQGGVIRDQLNDYLRPFGVFFAPTLSTSNRATMGGMANTDACGFWELRKKDVGLLGHRPGVRRPVAFVEDTAVAPAHLADYIIEFRQLLDGMEVPYGMFGHCSENALITMSLDHWRTIFTKFSLDLATPAVGCCGMAGTFGHEAMRPNTRMYRLNSTK